MSDVMKFMMEYGHPAIALVQLIMCALLCKVAFNDLPHIHEDIRGLAERISNLEGRLKK